MPFQQSRRRQARAGNFPKAGVRYLGGPDIDFVPLLASVRELAPHVKNFYTKVQPTTDNIPYTRIHFPQLLIDCTVWQSSIQICSDTGFGTIPPEPLCTLLEKMSGSNIPDELLQQFSVATEHAESLATAIQLEDGRRCMANGWNPLVHGRTLSSVRFGHELPGDLKPLKYHTDGFDATRSTIADQPWGGTHFKNGTERPGPGQVGAFNVRKLHSPPSGVLGLTRTSALLTFV